MNENDYWQQQLSKLTFYDLKMKKLNENKTIFETFFG